MDFLGLALCYFHDSVGNKTSCNPVRDRVGEAHENGREEGRHCFGEDYRDNILNQLEAPILCANIVWQETGQPALGQPYVITEREGIRIGIIGVTTEYIPHWELPAHYEGLAFLDAYQVAKKYAEQIRPQVDVLILAYHGGFERDLNSF